jgi:hypothetical protein
MLSLNVIYAPNDGTGTLNRRVYGSARFGKCKHTCLLIHHPCVELQIDVKNKGMRGLNWFIPSPAS